MSIAPEERVLDWTKSPDPRNADFPLQAALTERPRRRNKLWRPSPVLDQGREGACVGFAWAAEALSTPVAVDLQRAAHVAAKEPQGFALELYRSAQKVDEWEGEAYSGTSVNAGAKAMRERGLLHEYRWCFGVEDVIDAVLAKGPVVLGIPWLDGMYRTTPEGVLRVYGEVVGGHAILVVGYRVADDRLDGADGVILQNSWGENWGIGGRALLSLPDLQTLLGQGEAALATRRSYGR